jgi:peptide/nickel transport system permease protein
MLTFIVRRVAAIVPTLVFVSILIFGLQQLLPGDPAMVLAGEERDPTVIAHLRETMHLDQPFPIRYLYWLRGVLHGDLGESLRLQQPVGALIAEKLPVTLELACIAIVIALAIGIPAGVVSAVKRGTAWDYGANVVALWGLSTPNFWLGIMLILLFSVTLGWLPASGYVSPFDDWRANIASMIMPAFVLGNAIAAVLMRHTRSAMLQVLSSDYVRTARAKGLRLPRIVVVHVLRNSLTPLVSAVVPMLALLVTGAFFVEEFFGIPGASTFFLRAAQARDYPLLLGLTVALTVVVLVANLLADTFLMLVDPRLRERE